MKFDFAIGNPPYQETQEATSDTPVYNSFMDAAYEVAEKVELITPARFLFNAGKTPKAWNEKMLKDEHLKVSYYEQDSSKIFANTDIKGGVVVTYRDSNKDFGAIDIFTQYPLLNTILGKVRIKMHSAVSDIVYAPESYRFTELMHKDHPDIVNLLSTGHAYDLTSNIFDKLLDIVFYETKPKDSKKYIRILGRKNNTRMYMWILAKYVCEHENLNQYKIFFPKSNGSGHFGETMTAAEIGEPLTGHTQTFLSIGSFNSKHEASTANKYLITKFARAMLGVLKVTQDNKKAVWKYVPLQDFTENSDIDWSKSVAEIDRQLYRKYGLSDDEIAFIESNVKEMA